MDELEMIKEIANVLDRCCNEYDDNGKRIRNLCGQCEYWSDDNHCCCSYNKKEATALYNANCRIIGEDEMVIKKSEYETLKAQNDTLELYNKDLKYTNKQLANANKLFAKRNDEMLDELQGCTDIKAKTEQEAKREILNELNDEGYKIYKQQGNTFDADNFNWLIAYTMRKHGIELEK